MLYSWYRWQGKCKKERWAVIAPAQIIIAAPEEVRAGAGVNMDLTQKEFLA